MRFERPKAEARGLRTFEWRQYTVKSPVRFASLQMNPNGLEELTHHGGLPNGLHDGPYACAKSYSMGKKLAAEDDELVREVEGRVRWLWSA